MIAICVGHSRGDGGAVSVGGVNEWNFNRDIATRVRNLLVDRGIQACFIDRYAQAGYTRAMDYLAAHLKSMQVACAVELHFNSGPPTAAGHEWLYWHQSSRSRDLARLMDEAMSQRFPRSPRRGIKPIGQGMDERGRQFLQKTHCPAIIAEPFFGSHAESWNYFNDHRQELAEVIAHGIDTWKGAQA